MHTERYLSAYISIPSFTFRYGQKPSDTHLLRSLAYKTVQCDVSNRCLLSKYSHTSIYGCDVSIRSIRNSSYLIRM